MFGAGSELLSRGDSGFLVCPMVRGYTLLIMPGLCPGVCVNCQFNAKNIFVFCCINSFITEVVRVCVCVCARVLLLLKEV